MLLLELERWADGGFSEPDIRDYLSCERKSAGTEEGTLEAGPAAYGERGQNRQHS